MVKTLPRYLTLPKARKFKAEAFASLTSRELELLLLVESPSNGMPKGTLFGGHKGTSCVVTTRSIDRPYTVERIRTDELPSLLKLEKGGWLRFGEMSLPGEEDPTGFFWLTDSAKNVFRACREGKRPLLLGDRRGPAVG